MTLRYRVLALYYFLDVNRPTRRDLVYWIAGYAGFTACVIAASLGIITAEALMASPVPESANHAVETTVRETTSTGQEPPWLALLGWLWVAAVWEEIAFRNFIQKLLTHYGNAYIGIVVTSLVFAGLHLPSYGGLRPGVGVPILMAFLSALWLGWAYHRTRNVTVAILIHGCINTTALVSLYLG